MIAFPFAFFLVLLVWSIKKKGFICSSTLLLFFYCIISFGAILIDYYKVYSHICPYVNIQTDTGILYCTLLFVTMIPLFTYKEEKIVQITPLKSTKILDYVVYFYVISLFIMILLTYQDVFRNILLLQMVDNMKMRFRMGDEDIVTLKGFSLFLYNKWRFFGTASIYLCFYYFYSIVFQKKSWVYNTCVLIGSMSCIYDGMLHVDRSSTTYWMMYFFLCFVLFYRFMEKTTQKKMTWILGSFVLIVVLYMIFINNSRFTSGEGNDFLISYLGQSYINFATFYQKLHLTEFSLANNFPLINSLVSPEMTRDEWNLIVESQTGINTMVFSTFIGDMMAFIGTYYTILWVIGFFFISRILLKRKCTTTTTVHSLFLFSMLYSVVYLGIFATYFHYYNKELCALAMFMIFYSSRNKVIYKHA